MLGNATVVVLTHGQWLCLIKMTMPMARVHATQWTSKNSSIDSATSGSLQACASDQKAWLIAFFICPSDARPA